MRCPFVAALIASGCGSSLSPGVIQTLPRAAARVDPPRVVEQSARQRPSWLDGTSSSADAIGMVGEGSAPTLDEARARAEQDLLAAVAAYVAAEVASEFEIVETHATRNGEVVEDSQHVHEQKRTRAGGVVRRLQPDGFYWQKVESAAGAAFRCAVHATVPRAHIALARFRQSDPSKAWVLLLVNTEAGVPDGAATLETELANRLEAEVGYRVFPPALVEGSGAANEEELLGLIDPDVVARVSIRDLGARLEVAHDARWAGSEVGAALGRVRRPKSQWLELQDVVVEAVRRDIAAVVTAERAP